ncbi:MAG: tRNA lysidine(34) synthetase TilS, partial [Ignavibacteriae bacterium]
MSRWSRTTRSPNACSALPTNWTKSVSTELNRTVSAFLEDLLEDLRSALLVDLRSALLEDLHLVIGVSGGIDSIVLLHVLHHLAPYHHLKLVVAHAHHGLRDVEADDDERFVIGVCDEFNIPCVTTRLNVHQHAEGSGKGLEASARELRYAFFARVAEEHQARWIAVGHTADDVAETMIMHLARASGVDGLSAHRPVRTLPNGVHVIRPLIGVQRSDVADYAATHGLRWREDTSNTDPQFLRNVVRAQIMPAMRAVFGSDVGTRMALSASLLADASEIVHDAV